MSITHFGDPTTRAHEMPLGAALLPDGKVRFQLWAPSARTVDLCLYGANGSKQLIALERGEDGKYSTVTSEAQTGTRYHYRINNEMLVPDPASRFQPQDVHGPSEVIDPRQFAWHDSDWKGLPWEQTVLYELHVGTFSPEGTFAGLRKKLPEIADLGITAIELMPLADFPGSRNWGYDGVLFYAPDSSYGRPEELKALIEEAHRLGLMVFLDVVYNHFGPEGNYLNLLANQFFTKEFSTPWGQAIDYSQPCVRSFIIENALYWLNEYHFDGLRLDAVNTIYDDSQTHILRELSKAVKNGPGSQRHIHLVLENDNNDSGLLERDEHGKPRFFTAQWNDDFHHAAHVIVTGEKIGYYADYEESQSQFSECEHLGRTLSTGFSYQGNPSHFRENELRGQPSSHLPATCFVSFIQNHDQVGNRAFGERLGLLTEEHSLKAAAAILLLAPSPPLLFMGEEWLASSRFFFFCNFGGDLAPLVTAGRRKEFAKFPAFQDPANQEKIPDPSLPATFEASHLNWEERAQPEHQKWLSYYKALLAVRHSEIIPRLSQLPGGVAGFKLVGPRALCVNWQLGDGSTLHLLANLSHTALSLQQAGARDVQSGDRVIFRTTPEVESAKTLEAWGVIWTLNENGY